MTAAPDSTAGIVSFCFTAHALLAEKVLKRAGLKAELVVPSPQLDQSCTLGLVVDLAHRQEIETMLKENKIRFDAITPLGPDL